MFKEKLAKLQKFLTAAKYGSLLLGNFGCHQSDDLLYWLTFIKPERALLHIPARGRPCLFAAPFEVRELQKQLPECKVLPFNQTPEKLLASVAIKKIPTLPAAFRPTCLPYSIYNQLKKSALKLAPLAGEAEIMAVKSPSEIKFLRQVCRITDKLFASLIRRWQSFATEKDAAKFLLTAMAKLGVEPSFAPIIASGKHAAHPHHATGPNRLKRGFCVIDMGVRRKGYCSDMTRTIFIGRPSGSELNLYEKIRSAQTETAARVRSGVTTAELDKFCRSHLGAELNREFTHGLGHGLGTEVHEWPRVGGGQPVKLQDGMVITIEPGVYRAGRYGIRIEDDILVQDRGAEVLTESTKQLLLV